MDSIIKLIENNNQDCRFTETIQIGKYLENISSDNSSRDNSWYNNLVFCILDNYDLILSNTIKNDKIHILNQRVIEILSKLEDDDFYNKLGYNEKIMKRRTIQNNLQISLKKKNMISTIYYLNDYFNIHFVIVDLLKKEYYETTSKNYPKVYLNIKKNKYMVSDTFDVDNNKKDITDSIFEIDVKPNIYKTYLESIGKYKIGDLREIAKELNIHLFINNKSKTKQVIYEEINLHKLNCIS